MMLTKSFRAQEGISRSQTGSLITKTAWIDQKIFKTNLRFHILIKQGTKQLLYWYLTLIWEWDDSKVLQRVKMSDLRDNLQCLLWISSGLCSDSYVFASCLEFWKFLTCDICNKLCKIIWKRWIISQGGLFIISGQLMVYKKLISLSEWKWL